MFSEETMKIMRHDAKDGNLVKAAKSAAGRKAAAQGKMDALESISSNSNK